MVCTIQCNGSAGAFVPARHNDEHIYIQSFMNNSGRKNILLQLEKPKSLFPHCFFNQCRTTEKTKRNGINLCLWLLYTHPHISAGFLEIMQSLSSAWDAVPPNKTEDLYRQWPGKFALKWKLIYLTIKKTFCIWQAVWGWICTHFFANSTTSTVRCILLLLWKKADSV